jgi:hypothetical protein
MVDNDVNVVAIVVVILNVFGFTKTETKNTDEFHDIGAG